MPIALPAQPRKNSLIPWSTQLYQFSDAFSRPVTLLPVAHADTTPQTSKGAKKLSDWLQSDYCKKRGITKDSVAEVVKRALVVQPNVSEATFQQISVRLRKRN